MPEGQLFTVAALEGDQHWSPTDSTDSTAIVLVVNLSVIKIPFFSPSVVVQNIKRKMRAFIPSKLKEMQMWSQMYDICKFFISILICLAS